MNRIWKRLICVLLTLCLLLSAAPSCIFAADLRDGQTEPETELFLPPAESALQLQTRFPSAADAFTDVNEGKWYYDAVCYVAQNDIFSGTSSTTFSPNGTMTRAMVVTVLGRMAGVDKAEYTEPTGFSDVKEGGWYAPYVKWAVKYGITSGTGNGKFSPDRDVTREEMAALFVRYFTAFGVSLGDENLLDSEPSDLDSVAAWAESGVLVLWQRGLMVGSGDGSFSPKKNMTRAECAVLCMQIHKTVGTWKPYPGENEWKPLTPGGDGEYTITFAEMDGTVLLDITVRNGTGLGSNNVPWYGDPDPVNDLYFWGWCLQDLDGTWHLLNALYPYNRDVTAYAVVATYAEAVNYIEDRYYIFEDEVGTDFTVTVRPAEPGTELDPVMDLVIYGDEDARAVSYLAEKQENGDYVISVDGYTPGCSYNMVISDAFVFVVPEKDENGGVRYVALEPLVRYVHFRVEKPVNAEMRFRSDIIWVPQSKVGVITVRDTYSLGIIRDVDNSDVQLGTGTISFTNRDGHVDCHAGSVVCVYSDAFVPLHDAEGHPITVARQAPNRRDYDEAAYEGKGYCYADLYGNDTESFYILTDVKEDPQTGDTVCDYREMSYTEIGKIIYLPDVIPFRVDSLPAVPEGESGTVENCAAYDPDLYASCNGDKIPNPVEGDFVVFYTSAADFYGEDDFEAIRNGRYSGEVPYVYGRITAVDGSRLTYVPATLDEVVEAQGYINNYYLERYVPMVGNPLGEDLTVFEEEAEAMLDEEAVRAFLTGAIRADADEGNEEAAEALDLLQNNEISFSADCAKRKNGTEPDNSKKVEITGKRIRASVDNFTKFLPRSDGRWQIGLNLGMMLIIKLKLNDNANLYYTLSANFVQEFSFGITANGVFDVDWYLFVPVPNKIELDVSLTAETATDVTLDVRHYFIDKTYYGMLYGRQANCQEMWNNFQEFLLGDAFVTRSAAIYAMEADYYSLVADALAVDPQDVEAREAAEAKVRLQAKKINTTWTEKDAGIDLSWKALYKNGGSQEFSNEQMKQAEKAAVEGKDKLVAFLRSKVGGFNFLSDLVDIYAGNAAADSSKLDKGMTELADMNSEGTETEEWKDAQKALEAAKAEQERLKKESEAQKQRNKDAAKWLEGFLQQTEEYLTNSVSYLKALKSALEIVQAQMRLHPERNAESIAKMDEIIGYADKLVTSAEMSKRIVKAGKDLMKCVSAFFALSSAKEASDMIAPAHKGIVSLNNSLRDMRLILSEFKEKVFEEGSGDWNRCNDGISVIDAVLYVSEPVTELLEWGMYLSGLGTKDGMGWVENADKTDGITGVPTNTNYWTFRMLRTAYFQEFSLNTEIVDRLNSPDDGLNDDNIKVLADKYAEMCRITNTWMDLYRKPLVDKDIPIFAGLAVNVAADFVVQANINVGLNFNFHLEYGKAFDIKLDILNWKVTTGTHDLTNQQLSISMIAMGTLGLRTGFEVKVGLTIIKIFKVRVTFEIMPYVNVYGYMLFQYTRNLKSGDSDTKLKGALYLDVGVHFGINLALTMDIWVYKNTWKFSLYRKDLSIVDLGERKNVYNFAYPQPSPEQLTEAGEDVKTVTDGTASETEKEDVDTTTGGLMIVNASTGYTLPAAARFMSYMDMTTGGLGKSSFDASKFKYTFFTVPREEDGISYPVEGNLPVRYKTEEVPLTDADGNIVYEENEGRGIPLEITVDADASGPAKDYVLVANKGTPVKTVVQTNEKTIDFAGIEAGDYVEDTRFSVNGEGVITYTPDNASAGVIAQDVYVYIEWKEGKLEVSNYPLRRVLHILWSNEDPVTWVETCVNIVDEDGEESTVFSRTTYRGKQYLLPPVFTILDSCDPDGLIYDRNATTYVGSADNWGTWITSQQNKHYYISATRQNYTIEIHGLNPDGSGRVETYTAAYGDTFPLPEVFTSKVTTTDVSGNPQYLKFAGYQGIRVNDGNEEVWEKDYRQPVKSELAKDLADPYMPHFLKAEYEDETVTATFTFAGAEQDAITQYLRRGSMPDESPVLAVLRKMQTDALAEGQTLNFILEPQIGTIVTNTEYVIKCCRTQLDAPGVLQDGTVVRLTSAAELKENDVLVFGCSVGIDDVSGAVWLAPGVAEMAVEPDTDYYFYCRLTDGDTLFRTYSPASPLHTEGARTDTGYSTMLHFYSVTGNPSAPVQLSVIVNYTTGVPGEEQVFTIETGEMKTLILPAEYTPDLIAGVLFRAEAPSGGVMVNTYKFTVYAESMGEDGDYWASRNVTQRYKKTDTGYKKVALTLTLQDE